MITAYFELIVTTPKGEKLKMVFVDDQVMFNAHLAAERMGHSTDYYDHIAHGYSIMRKEADYLSYLNSWTEA